MTKPFTQKTILYLIVSSMCLQYTYTMDRKLDFNSVEEATLLVPCVHPWTPHKCCHVMNICHRMLELSRMPATQAYIIEKFITFTNGMIREIRSENCGHNFGDEQHRLICYKKLMAWEIQKRESWFNIRHKPDQQLKRSVSYEKR